MYYVCYDCFPYKISYIEYFIRFSIGDRIFMTPNVAITNNIIKYVRL